MIFLELFLTFLKVGAFTFGGGYAMLPLIQQAVAEHGWIDTARLLDFIAVSESTPGPFAINIATFIGAEQAGIAGAACATLGVVLPSFLIILIVACVYEKFKRSRAVKGVMSGLKPAVVGLIAAALLNLLSTVFAGCEWNGIRQGVLSGEWHLLPLGTAALLLSLALFGGSTVAAFKKVHPILIILVCAAAGIGAGYLGVWG